MLYGVFCGIFFASGITKVSAANCSCWRDAGWDEVLKDLGVLCMAIPASGGAVRRDWGKRGEGVMEWMGTEETEILDTVFGLLLICGEGVALSCSWIKRGKVFGGLYYELDVL